MAITLDGTTGITSPAETVAGAVTAASVAATGAVSGTTGTFTGAVSGTTGTFTGVSTFPAGTALLPAITTTGDTNTGVWFPAADTVAVSTSGAEAIRINSSSNVGIGASSPVAKVQIKGSGTSGQVTSSFILENASSGTGGMDITGDAGSSRWRFLYGGGPNTGTNSLTEGMCLTTEGASAGNVTLQKNISVGAATPTTSGSGITFPATQSASTDANTLDDYEEGTWTPALARVGASTLTYTTQNGFYVKIGKQVTLYFRIMINAVSAQGSSVNYVTNLPFAGYTGDNGIIFIGSVGINTAFLTVTVTNCQQAADGVGNITFHQATNNGNNVDANWVAGGIVAGTCTYFTN